MPRPERKFLREIPTVIHHLDLFAGNCSFVIGAAARSPQQMHVAVDRTPLHRERLAQLPSNARFLQGNALDVLDELRAAGARVGQVHIQFSMHEIPHGDRPKLFAKIAAVLAARGGLRIVTRVQGAVPVPELVRQVTASGFKLERRGPFLPGQGQVLSETGLANALGYSGVRSIRRGATPNEAIPVVPSAVWLAFRKK